MKNLIKNKKERKYLCNSDITMTKERLIASANYSEDELYAILHSGENGMTEINVSQSRKLFGENSVSREKRNTWLKRVIDSFVNPFTAILCTLAIISTFTDIVLVENSEQNYMTVTIITTMVFISGILRFIQETRSGNAALKLSKMIHTTTCVERVESGKGEISFEEVVVGDIVHLSAGDMIPADIRIIEAKDLFVSQSSLTGESEPVEKTSLYNSEIKSAIEIPNLVFLGSNVISGVAKGIVILVGKDTMLGNVAEELNAKPEKTTFEKGMNAVSFVLIRYMLVMVPIVLFINGYTKGDWMSAAMFAISVAVGLTPEMLPMIVTTALAKGAVVMSKKKVIIKKLNAIQNLGSMDILCTDKTGTLTQDKVVLEYHLNIQGYEDKRVLKHAFLNSFYQTGLRNLIDKAIISKHYEVENKNIEEMYTKVDEIPFDFNRRRMSVVVSDNHGKTQMITKGAVEEMLKCCAYAEYDGRVESLTEEIKTFVNEKAAELNDDGMRVIAVAHKTNPSPAGEFSVNDENNMVLIGFLAFLDPPKETTAMAIKALNNYGIDVKILTGDNEKVTKFICKQVGIQVNEIMLGTDIDDMSDEALRDVVDNVTIFAKLSPSQKARVVSLLRENGHTVGYMGDGINDATAMKASDVGISVDSAVDIAKESAHVILLEKDLMVLESGIIEGRKTYANMIKYIKMTASSNFGNMFSVLAASAFLPFLPMASIQLILLNLIYDISCTAIPWDNVDNEYLKKPRKWDASSVSKFMIWIGPASSIFDITTYLLMYFIICPAVLGGLQYNQITDASTEILFIATFQAGWFIESMWSQTLVIHMIRTVKIPFVQSRASFPVSLLTVIGVFVVTLIPFTKFGTIMGLASLPKIYF